MERFLGGLVIGALGVGGLVRARKWHDVEHRPRGRLLDFFLPPGTSLDRWLTGCFGAAAVVWAVLVWCHAI